MSTPENTAAAIIEDLEARGAFDDDWWDGLDNAMKADLTSRIAEIIEESVDGNTSDGFHTFVELYEYRLLYNAALFNEWATRGVYDVHKSRRHHDGEWAFGGGWFVVVAQLPAGQVSNHYPDKDWDLFDVPARPRAAEWDGHTPAEAAARLRKLLAGESL